MTGRQATPDIMGEVLTGKTPSENVEQRSVNELHPHPRNDTVYGDRSSPDLVASVRTHGVLNPLLITADGVIISGHRRWDAARIAGLATVPVVVSPLTDDLDILAAMIESNRQRQRTNEQLAREAKELLDIETERAKRRQATSGPGAYGAKPLVVNSSQAVDTGKARQKAGEQLGIGGQKVDKLVKVIEAADTLRADGNDEAADDLVKTLNKRSAHAAYTKAQRNGYISKPSPEPAAPPVADRHPRLIVGLAEDLSDIEDATINVIVTSPPYNLGGNPWDMGNRGSRDAGVGYDDDLQETDYRLWQRDVLTELYRVAADGASLFYNHKVRVRKGKALLPTEWVSGLGWTLRQVIIWDRTSTHNHEPRLFWPHDEWVLWMTKGKPDLRHPINMPSIWSFHGPVPNTWHPAPFADELPRRCLQAVGFPGCVVLDPFAGSCATLKVALEMGFDAIGADVSADYLRRAAAENGWRFEE